MTLIRDVLEKDPARKINPVIKVDMRDPREVGAELEEYVVTEEIKEYLQDIIDRFILRGTKPESVCAWISGFFGSGKSHFLKFLGYLLSNEKVVLEDGREVGAAEYFCKIHELKGSAILGKELKTKVVFINMLGSSDSSESSSFLRIIFNALMKELGLSEVPWVAETEKMIQEKGLWEKFLEFVKEDTGREWEEERRLVTRARPLLARALYTIDPKTYYSIEIAEKSINDAEKNFSLTPEKLVEELKRDAEKVGGEKGRIAVMLDEVGLYIGTNTDRMNELQAIAETIDRLGNGRVWLFVTAQEAIEEKIPQVERTRAQFEKIKDRFMIKVTLTPENIDTVVKKRLLTKTSDPGRINELKELYQNNSGELTLSALIRDPAKDPGRLLTSIDEKNFIESYPLMPYHILLMQDIFGALRGGGGASLQLTGRERSVLGVVRALLADNLAGKELGTMATFDIVYDVIESELKIVRSEQMRNIKEIEKENNNIGSVAKALFLLQQIEWIPCTVENISAVVYPSLGTDGTELRSRVGLSLEELKKQKLVTEENGRWRFLSNVERSFEKEVDGVAVSMSEKRDLMFELISAHLKKFAHYDYEGIRTFDVHIKLDDEDVTSRGHVELFFYSPISDIESEKYMYMSLADGDRVFLISKKDDEFDRTLERIIQIEKALSKKSEERDELKRYRSEASELREKVAKLFDRTCTTLMVAGMKTELDGRKALDEVVRSRIKEIIDRSFTQFEKAKYRVEKDEHIGAILRGTNLPQVYRDLKLVDRNGNINIEGPVASFILQEVRRRKNQGEECSGSSLSEHFDSKPYGWDPKIVRMALATLFKYGSIGVKFDGKEIFSQDREAEEVFTNSRYFNRAVFYPSIEVSPEDRDKSWELLSEIFGSRVENTIEGINKGLKSALEEVPQTLYGKAEGAELPVARDLKSLMDIRDELLKIGNPNSKILKFLEKAEVLKEKVHLMDVLKDFDEKGNIEEYKRIREFLRSCGRELADVDENQIEKVEKLSNMIASTEFIDRWTDIKREYDSLKERYLELYSELHNKRNEAVSKAIEELTSKGYEFNKDLEAMRCNSFELDDEFLCRSCKTTLKDLSNADLYITKKKEEIEKKIGPDIEPPGPSPIYSWEVQTDKDIENIAEKLRSLVDEANREGKKVRVDIKVE